MRGDKQPAGFILEIKDKLDLILSCKIQNPKIFYGNISSEIAGNRKLCPDYTMKAV